MKTAYIIDGIRTPIGNHGGGLSGVRTDDLAALVITKLMEKYPQIDKSEIGDVSFGCANQSGEDNRNVARMALLLAGLPPSVPGETINRLCASGMAATMNGARAIMTGDGDFFISGGVESMTRAPYAISKTSVPFGRDAQIFDTTIGWRFVNPVMKEKFGIDSMGETAENVARMFNIGREDQDKFALSSQMKAVKARDSGRLAKEITHVILPQKKGDPKIVKDDEFIRSNTTLDILTKLGPAFRKDGTVTAGNASGINDGACALLLSSEEGLKKYNLAPLARVVSAAVTGVEPRIMGIGPVEAAKKALLKAGLTWNDISLIELNEAFAAQSLACIRQWGLEDADPRINPNGGAIALGHPLGMSGARLIQTAALELREKNLRFALCTMCVGVGQGYAVILEKI
ncbi:MAG: 3-oxoadipyl-CoA thiolase [Bacteroidetes bacterium]|nr:3-oxoadipyl-CoA thiolase [Bacteroidota bacterium]